MDRRVGRRPVTTVGFMVLIFGFLAAVGLSGCTGYQPAAAPSASPSGQKTPGTSTAASSVPSPQVGAASPTPNRSSSPSAAASSGTTSASVSAGWQTVSLPERGYSVSFPGEPTPEKDTPNTVRALLPDHNSCDVRVVRNALAKKSVEEWLESCVPRSFKELGIYSPYSDPYDLTVQKISIAGHPGRELTYKTLNPASKTDRWEHRSRVYCVNGVGYVVSWRGPEGRIPLGDLQKFFDSFRPLDAGKKGPGPDAARR